ncbi:hypothetical protein [Companilactobacillus kimchii]|uniref:Uncharacterized protein n=2 Tax=Companilactobacillus kimchii TaxID=2801452 RepID=A0ABR5NWE3_9LACO|nr:hypothetical protein [Companilactobacillus kimchii]KRK53118.1 hypothetical protein FC97_GL001583 [Companilactobacillus kimchii DSM 13961 = JCM 10707]OWF32831.1 hypothetical protein LKACC12383_01704 [Companilactobacillus kimchii]GEO48478.1 hypothetical protein LKI01_24770 [Companilactobacillus paralimentarius]
MNEIKIKAGKIYIDDIEINNVSDISIIDQSGGNIRIGITFLSKSEDKTDD